MIYFNIGVFKNLKKILLVVALIIVATLTACLPGRSSVEDAAPDIKFVIPGENTSGFGLSGVSSCPVTVDVSNFRLVDKAGEENVSGEGHIHYFLDVSPPTEPEKPAITAEGTYADIAESFYYWPNVGEGEHTFSAELVNNDHTPLDPPVVTSITVTAGLYWDG